MNVLDLYAGMGGFGVGFKNRFDILDAVDFWQDACKTYSMNHQETKVHQKDVIMDLFKSDEDKPLPAIVNVLKNRIVHPNRQGYVSFDDIKKAQGFDETYLMYGNKSSKAQQLANAIPVELASSFAEAFFEKLRS